MRRVLVAAVVFAASLHAQLVVRTVCGPGGPISQSSAVSSGETINAQSGTTYTYQNTDCGKLITHSNAMAIAGTLPQANATTFRSGWFTDVQNIGAGTLTITPTTSTIDGAATLTLTTNQGVRIVSNETNYFTQRGGAGAVASVPTTRLINTTSPLTGGGDLSADRTLACPTCVPNSRTVSTTAPLGGGGALSGNLTLTCTNCGLVFVTASDPVCAMVSDIGKLWFDTTSATDTHLKACVEIASAPTWATII